LLGSNWTPPDDWLTSGGKVRKLLEPVQQALQGAPRKYLEQVAKAMQVLKVPGRRDQVPVEQMKRYLAKKPAEPSLNGKKKQGFERWKGRALIVVAQVLLHHDVAMAAALQLEAPIDELPSLAQQVI
jgi:hypothetical protein